MHFQLRILCWQMAKKAVPGHLPVRHWIIRHTLSNVLDNALNTMLTVVDDEFMFSLVKIHINSEKNPAVSHIIPNSIPQVTSYCKDHPYPTLRSCRIASARSAFPFQPSYHCFPLFLSTTLSLYLLSCSSSLASGITSLSQPLLPLLAC